MATTILRGAVGIDKSLIKKNVRRIILLYGARTDYLLKTICTRRLFCFDGIVRLVFDLFRSDGHAVQWERPNRAESYRPHYAGRRKTECSDQNEGSFNFYDDRRAYHRADAGRIHLRVYCERCNGKKNGGLYCRKAAVSVRFGIP